MDRRKFLAWLGGTAAGVAAAPYLDVEKLLWLPGEKTIFLPPPPTRAMPQVGDILSIPCAVDPITQKFTGGFQKFLVTAVVGDCVTVEPSVITGYLVRPVINAPAKARPAHGAWRPPVKRDRQW